MEINYPFIFKKYRKFILYLVIITAGMSSIVVYRMPSYYQASVKIYSDNYVAVHILYNVVGSEEIVGGVIKKLKFEDGILSVKSGNITRDDLKDAITEIFHSRNNLLEIKIRWKDAGQATVIANSFIEELKYKYPEPDPSRIKENTDVQWLVINDGSYVQKIFGPKEKVRLVFFSIFLSFVLSVFLSLVAEIIGQSERFKILFFGGSKLEQ